MTYDRVKRSKNRNSDDSTNVILCAAENAVKTIAQAAVEARNVITADAAEAVKVLVAKNTNGGTDHDLLIKLDTKVDQIQLDVTTLKNQENLYVNQVEHKAVCDKQADHEIRLRLIERYGSMAIGALFIIEFVLKFFVK